jgi:hypothetical protein
MPSGFKSYILGTAATVALALLVGRRARRKLRL